MLEAYCPLDIGFDQRLLDRGFDQWFGVHKPSYVGCDQRLESSSWPFGSSGFLQEGKAAFLACWIISSELNWTGNSLCDVSGSLHNSVAVQLSSLQLLASNSSIDLF